MNKLISIIIPVFQAEHYLQASVDTALNQTYSNIEVILIDDGSTDASKQICDAYAMKDTRVTVVHKKNGGQASARNCGLRIARGDYIAFLDNDDFMYPEMCEVLVNNIEKYNADISSCSFIQKDEKGKITHEKHTNKLFFWNNKESMKAFLERRIMDIYVWTKLYRTTLLKRNNIYFEEGRNDEDFLFNYLAFKSASYIIMVDCPLYIYNFRRISRSRTLCLLEFRKYLDDTWYRLNKIETSVSLNYPEYIFFAKRQTILYIYMMLSIMISHSQEDCMPYYKNVMRYLYINRKQIIKDRKYWGISYIGLLFSIYMNSRVYFILKKWKMLFFKHIPIF